MLLDENVHSTLQFLEDFEQFVCESQGYLLQLNNPQCLEVFDGVRESRVRRVVIQPHRKHVLYNMQDKLGSWLDCAQDCRQECKDLRGHFRIVNMRVDDCIAPLLLHLMRCSAIRICASPKWVIM